MLGNVSAWGGFEDCELLLAQEAMQRACEIVAARAEAVAQGFDREASPIAAAPARCACSPAWSGSPASAPTRSRVMPSAGGPTHRGLSSAEGDCDHPPRSA